MGAEPDAIRRNVAFSFAAQFASAVFTAVLVLLLARVLEPEGYGLFAVALGMGALAQIPVDFGLAASTARFVAERRSDNDAVIGVLADALRAKAALSSLVCLALFALAQPIAEAYGEAELVWPLRGIALAVLGQSFFAFFNTVFIGLSRTSLQLRNYVSESAIEFSASVAFVLAGAGATGAAFGRAAGYVAGAVIGGWLLGRLFGGRLRGALTRDHGNRRMLLGYAGPVLLVESAFVAFEQVDVLVAGAVLGAGAAGLLQAPLRLVTFMHLVGSAVANGVAPRQAGPPEARDVGAFVSALRGLLVLHLLLAALVLAWATPLVDLALGDDFAESADVLRALAPFVFLSGLGPLVGLTASYLGLAGIRVPITVAAVLLNAVLDVILIPEIGIVGGAIATDVAYTVYLIAHVVVVRRALGFELRPLVIGFARGTLAAAALAGVLVGFGTGPLGFRTMLLGSAAATTAALLVLMVTGELNRSMIRGALARVGVRR